MFASEGSHLGSSAAKLDRQTTFHPSNLSRTPARGDKFGTRAYDVHRDNAGFARARWRAV